MKKLFVIAGICMTVWACNNGSSDKATGEDSTYATDQSAKSQQSDADTAVNNIGTDRHEAAGVENSNAAGKALIEKADCLTCHREHEKLVGPAYADVAKKYTNNDDNIGLLAKKIIEGGKGVWGEVPMTAHPAVSESDAKEMVRYILSIK